MSYCSPPPPHPQLLNKKNSSKTLLKLFYTNKNKMRQKCISSIQYTVKKIAYLKKIPAVVLVLNNVTEVHGLENHFPGSSK